MSDLKVTRIQDEIIIKGGTPAERDAVIAEERAKIEAAAARFGEHFKGITPQQMATRTLVTEDQARAMTAAWRVRWRQ